jgi:dolichol-phosphate mannosyltransferase
VIAVTPHTTVPTPGIVVPAFKEAETIGPLIQAILQALPRAQILVVDDSPDAGTVEAVTRLRLPAVRVVHRATKGGRGSAVLDGLRDLHARGCEPLVEMDADHSHPPSQLPALIDEAAARGLDLLIASRYVQGSRIVNWPVSRRVFSALSNRLARLVLGVPIADYTNGYRVYSPRGAATVLATCGTLGKGFIALSESLVNLHYRGFRVGETPTVFTNRVRGESSLSYSEIRSAFVGLFRISALRRQLEASRRVGRLETGD